MGRRNKQRKNAAMLDSDDESSSVSSSSSLARSDRMSLSGADALGEDIQFERDSLLQQALDALFEKRGATREKALALIIESFSTSLQYQFIEKNSATLLHQCLNCIKKGSTKELSLACHAIGLLALTAGQGDNTREILEDSYTPISQALKTTSDSLKIAALVECLAIANFVGGSYAEETEKSMQIMWQLLNPKLGTNVVMVKPSVAVMEAVVSSWTLLLTTMCESDLSATYWQESLSFFSSLLDKDDRSIRIAAGEALVVMFELGSLQKFCSAKLHPTESSLDVNKPKNDYNHIHGWKSKIQNQIQNLSAEAGGKGSAKKDLTTQRNFFKDALDFLEGGYSPETTIKVGGDLLNISTWRQLKQLNYLKRFLGSGFAKHLQDNEFIREVFGFVRKKKLLQDVDPLMHKQRSPYAAVSKARTQHLNKQRMLSEGINIGHFAVNTEDGL